MLSYGISRDILERLVRVTRSRDIFNTRSLMMFRWISSVPPAIEVAGPPRPFLRSLDGFLALGLEKREFNTRDTHRRAS